MHTNTHTLKKKKYMKARNQIQSRWLHLRLEGLGAGERWGRHRSSGSVWKARASVQSLLLRSAIHFTSWDKNHHITVRVRKGELGGLPWQIKKGGKLRWGRKERGGWGARRWGTWSGGKGCSDSSGAAEGEECRLPLPLQTSLPSSFTTAVINTCYFPLSAFQSIDKSGARPARDNGSFFSTIWCGLNSNFFGGGNGTGAAIGWHEGPETQQEGAE